MRTKTHSRRGFMRLTAFFLCMVCLFGLFPASAFALEPGQAASSWTGSQYAASDGGTYDHPTPWYSMTYHADGTTSYQTHAGNHIPYSHYMLTDSNGVTHSVFCVESGVAFNDSTNAYTSESGKNSHYLELLPEASRKGIMTAALYGWQPGASVPVSGINADDWKMATQVIIWEYQQQLRSDPYSRHNNGIIPADQFYGIVAGRPAEKAYNWILEHIASHTTVPSFTSSSKGSAPVLELEWDTARKVYTLTVTDTNNLNIDLETLSGSGVSVTRNGNKYTFTSKNMIQDPVTFHFRKNVPIADEMLIWGRPGYQTMLTGATDPVSFYVKIKTETYGTAKIVKTSEDGIVSGISFNISGTDILGHEVNETVTTGENGQVEKDFLPGTYLVAEIPVDRYVTPAAQYVTIESGQTSSVHFSNILKKFRVKVNKTDADTGSAQGDATLAGAVYGLYKGGELVDTYTTGPDGDFLTRYYVCGDDWTLREMEPSTGYLLNDTVYDVGASPRLYEVELNTTENTVMETVIYGNVQLVKHTDEKDPDVSDEEHSDDANAGMVEKPEAGAVFEVFLKSAGSYDNAKESERDRLTTDADGFAASKQLPYGHYTVHQVSGEEGKALVPDFTVFISEDGHTYSYILNNDTLTARLRVEKHDTETGNLIPMTGTGYRIKDLSTGEFVSQQIYYPNPETLDVFYVSDEGWMMLPEPLHTGDYELYEVSAPYGYVLTPDPLPFTIDGSEAVVTVSQYNMPQKGQITITKTGEVFASVVENDGLFQPVYEVMGLPGAVYDVIADEDIYTGDGTLRVAKDTVVESITTGEDATATSGLLYLGRYRLEERQAPAGMVINTEPVSVELTYAGETVEVTHTSISLYDERQKVAVDLKKGLETDELFGIGLSDEYQDISFGLYAAYDLEALDGSVIPADGLLEVISVAPSDNGGLYGAFASDLPIGSYYVKERGTHKAYVISDAEYPVEFGYAGQETAVVTITANDGEAIENRILRGRIEGKKYGEALDGGEAVPLSGALMGLFAPDVEDFTEENALLTAVTGEDGAFAFEGIPYGHWIVAEISAPALYTVSPEQHHIYIGVDGQCIEIRVDDTLIRGSVQLMKTEAVGEPSPVEPDGENAFMRFLPGAVFELYEDTNGNKELDNEDTLLGELNETETGFHEAVNLLAKGYFVKEKTAPEGYKPDENAYYFEITEDGQTVIIENGEAGRGFTNEAYRGNLKIVKDSSDGRKDGFSIEVKSADGAYCETFVTPADGVIEVKGLRVGTYTVTEISNRASRGYIIPDAVTVEIKLDQLVTVRLFNEKPEEPTTPETPTTPTTPGKPVPQTGDDASLFVWIGVLACSLAGGALFLFLTGRKGKHLKITAKDKAVRIGVPVLCVILALGSGFMLLREIGQYRESADAYHSLESYVDMPKETEPAADKAEDPSVESDAAEETAGTPAVSLPLVDFDALREISPDIIAWLTLEDTVINYPVTQADDNDYYLHHLHDKTYSKVGCLFADYENAADFSDRNTIIYGHNMRDGSMFASIKDYADQAYYDAHPRMFLITPEQGFVMEIFSAFVADPGESGKDTSPWRLDWQDDGEYAAWLEAMAGRSVIQSDVAVNSGDRVLTLSTCTNDSAHRFIVMGKLTPVN